MFNLSGKWPTARSVMVMRYGCYASGFGLTRTLPTFVFFFTLLFFRLRCYV